MNILRLVLSKKANAIFCKIVNKTKVHLTLYFIFILEIKTLHLKRKKKWRKLCLKSTGTSVYFVKKLLQKNYDVLSTSIGTEADSWCIQRAYELDCMPFQTRLLTLALRKEELASLFCEKRAKWHKICRNKFSTLKLERAQKRKAGGSDAKDDNDRKKLPRRSTEAEVLQSCFFCEEVSCELHRASTFNLDHNVRESAHILNDTALLGKLSAGDMVALDAVYHTQCLSKLYKRAAKMKNQVSTPTDEYSVCQGIALAELVSFLEEYRNDSDDSPVFKLSQLSRMYASRLEQMGVDISQRIHTTRLKERLIQQCPDLTSYKDGREVLLAFTEDVAAVLKKATETSSDSEAMAIAKAAKIIRRDLLNMEKSQFHDTFESNCQESSVPQSLRSLIEMIMGGASIKTIKQHCRESSCSYRIPADTIQLRSATSQRFTSQLSFKRSRDSIANIRRSPFTCRDEKEGLG